MKFLLDQGLPRSAVEFLAVAGIDAIHVADIGMPESDLATPDQRLALARRLIASFTELQPRKVQTSRSIQNAIPRERFMLFSPPLVTAILERRKIVTRRLITPQPICCKQPTHCPMAAVGDRIWVREKWGYREQFYDRNAENQPPYVYAADGLPVGAKYSPWKPSLHMPRVASRVLLRVTGVRSERLSDISAQDARDEGCPVERLADSIGWFKKAWDGLFAARGWGWRANPWVWVIAFEVTSK